MKRFSLAIILAAMLLTGCAKKPIPLEEALLMKPDALDRAVMGISFDELEKAWGEPETTSDNINGSAFSMGDEAIIIYDDPKGYVEDTRRCWWCEGRFVSGLDDADIVLIEMNGYIEPTVVSTAKFVSFEGIEDGDRVRLLIEGIAESYPCQAETYGVKLMEKGSYDDLDNDTMDRLREMGWVE